MQYLLIGIGILTVMVLVTSLVSKEKKTPGGNCKECPEFRYCGGGRHRCARRSERLSK